MKSEIKGIIFDLDGVLADMVEGHYESLEYALNIFGVSIPREEHRQIFNGLPTKKKLEKLVSENKLKEELSEIISEIKQFKTKEKIRKYCVQSYDKLLLLDYLRKEGYAIGCCSNSIQSSILEMLEMLGILDYFDVIIGNDMGFPQKPCPDMYLESINRLGLNLNNVIVVEDSQIGLEAVKNAGVKNIWKVKDPFEVNISNFLNLFID